MTYCGGDGIQEGCRKCAGGRQGRPTAQANTILRQRPGRVKRQERISRTQSLFLDSAPDDSVPAVCPGILSPPPVADRVTPDRPIPPVGPTTHETTTDPLHPRLLLLDLPGLSRHPLDDEPDRP